MNDTATFPFSQTELVGDRSLQRFTLRRAGHGMHQPSGPFALIRHLGVGLLAGAAGTAAMDILLYLRYRRDGGNDSLWRWEFAGGVTSWDNASAPGQLGQKLERFVTGKQPPDDWARTTTNLMHWATGVGWGLQYGALASRTSRHPWIRALGLGPVAWLASYAILPLARVYKPIWEYDARTLGDDLSAHLVFGIATSAVFAALTRTRRDHRTAATS